MKIIQSILAVLTTFMFMTQALAAQTWNIATGYPDSTFHTQNIYWFADKVKEATNGELQIQVHSGASMFKMPELKRALRSGQIPLAEFVVSSYGNENALYEADTIPFLAVGPAETAKLYELQKPLIEKRYKKEGIMPLYSVIWPENGLYINKKISRGEDLKGVKIRGQIPVVSKMGEMLGGVPVNVQFVEVAQAFTTGVLDAMFSATSNGVDMQAWEYIDHFYDLSAYQPRNVVAVNLKAWNSLSEDVQQKVLEVAKQAEERGWKMATDLHKKSRVVLAEHGLEVHQPSDELLSDFKKVSDQLISDWATRAGDDGAYILREMNAFKQANKNN